MNDLVFILLALVIGVVMRKVRQMSGLRIVTARLATVAAIVLAWFSLRAGDFSVTLVAGIVAAGVAVLVVRNPKPDKISLRCSGCGNYFPSRDHFASEQLCKTCHAALGGADQ